MNKYKIGALLEIIAASMQIGMLIASPIYSARLHIAFIMLQIAGVELRIHALDEENQLLHQTLQNFLAKLKSVLKAPEDNHKLD